MTQKEHLKNFDLRITEAEAKLLAPEVIDTLREFVIYASCRASNTHDRKSLCERLAFMAGEAQRKYHGLKLNHVGAKTIIIEKGSSNDKTE